MTNTTYFNSPLGLLEIRASDAALTALAFVKKKSGADSPAHPVLKKCVKQLAEYFAGKRRDFDLPLELIGTDFQKRVWGALLKIPYGQTASYGDIAKKIRNPKGPRAVGMANNRNNIAIVIPCHRVIGAGGKLVGYGGGLEKKKWLLELESGLK